MVTINKTVKIQFYPSDQQKKLLRDVTDAYRRACDFVSRYIFDNNFECNAIRLQERLYYIVREKFGLKSQMTDAVFRTVIARYKTERTKLAKSPYRYCDEKGVWQAVPRTLEWLQHPIRFSRPQADFTRLRDYSFVDNRQFLSLNTLEKRIRVPFTIPVCFEHFFDGSWKLGVAKVLETNRKWYIHISVSQVVADFDKNLPVKVVGIDRGLRFVSVTYDGEKTFFKSGKELQMIRDRYAKVRAQLQSKGTPSAKRVLKRLSGRENRWMTDYNHRLSKALVLTYGANTLFVVEDLTDISFSEKNLSRRSAARRRELRSWSFYQLEQFLSYKALENQSMVINVAPHYTSQRCPHCGRINKENRKHETHKYVCDICGYETNDDRVGAMNIRELGVRWLNGEKKPKISK